MANKDNNDGKAHTLAIHAGQSVEDRTLPSPPLSLGAATPLRSIEEGWAMLTNETTQNVAYQRYDNPTVSVLENKFALMEGANFALAVNSGMTACYLTFRALLKAGDHVISQHSLYHEISDQLAFDRIGCNVDFTLLEDYSTESFGRAIKPNTKMVFVETPTNPVMLDVNLPQLSSLCKERGVLLVVDNTLMTPCCQRPLDLGADVAVYSTTKNVSAGLALGGIVTTNDKDLYVSLRALKENTGLGLDPFSAYMTLNNLRTLPLRMERHGQNALELAKFMKRRYPRLPFMHPLLTPNAQTNKLTGSSGVVTITFPEKEMGTRFVRSLKLFSLATTFGNMESLVYHFGTFTRPHRNLDNIGLPYGLVRLSVGLEDIDAIVGDIDRAVAPIYKSIRPAKTHIEKRKGTQEPAV